MDPEDVQLVDIGVEYLVHETNAGRLEWILVGELDMDLPDTACERSCIVGGRIGVMRADNGSGKDTTYSPPDHRIVHRTLACCH